jgi:diketogulonate reductase-like aldo/keto reductase
MKYVEAGGVRMSAIGVGCWQFGSKDWGYGKEYGETTAVDIVHTALDLGVTLVDTAEAYARGASEAIVGRALIGRRAEAFVRRSSPPPTRRNRDTPPVRCASALTPSTLPDPLAQPSLPLRPQLDGMRTLVGEGVVASVGVELRRRPLAQADTYLGSRFSNQVHFSLLYRKPDKANVPRPGQRPDRDRVQPGDGRARQQVLGRQPAARRGPAAARSASPRTRRAEPYCSYAARIAAAHATPGRWRWPG